MRTRGVAARAKRCFISTTNRNSLELVEQFFSGTSKLKPSWEFVFLTMVAVGKPVALQKGIKLLFVQIPEQRVWAFGQKGF